MRFATIDFAASQPDALDPRSGTNNAKIPQSQIKETPETLTGTDIAPSVVVLTAEGTAADTIVVQMWAVDNGGVRNALQADDPTANNANRSFYSVGSPITVTVGACAFGRAVPGEVYYQLKTAPAHKGTVKIGFAAGAPT